MLSSSASCMKQAGAGPRGRAFDALPAAVRHALLAKLPVVEDVGSLFRFDERADRIGEGVFAFVYRAWPTPAAVQQFKLSNGSLSTSSSQKAHHQEDAPSTVPQQRQLFPPARHHQQQRVAPPPPPPPAGGNAEDNLADVDENLLNDDYDEQEDENFSDTKHVAAPAAAAAAAAAASDGIVGAARPVALKEVLLATLQDERDAHNVLREVSVLGRLEHDNVVGCHAAFITGQAVYLVMPYAPGVTLTELLRYADTDRRRQSMSMTTPGSGGGRVNGGLPESACREIARQLLDSLQYVQRECELIHRDVKLDNIMVAARNTDGPGACPACSDGGTSTTTSGTKGTGNKAAKQASSVDANAAKQHSTQRGCGSADPAACFSVSAEDTFRRCVEGAQLHVTLVDFGFARTVKAAGGSSPEAGEGGVGAPLADGPPLAITVDAVEPPLAVPSGKNPHPRTPLGAPSDRNGAQQHLLPASAGHDATNRTGRNLLAAAAADERTPVATPVATKGAFPLGTGDTAPSNDSFLQGRYSSSSFFDAPPVTTDAAAADPAAACLTATPTTPAAVATLSTKRAAGQQQALEPLQPTRLAQVAGPRPPRDGVAGDHDGGEGEADERLVDSDGLGDYKNGDESHHQRKTNSPLLAHPQPTWSDDGTTTTPGRPPVRQKTLSPASCCKLAYTPCGTHRYMPPEFLRAACYGGDPAALRAHHRQRTTGSAEARDESGSCLSAGLSSVVAFATPENLRKGDVFAAGVVAYALLSCSFPWSGSSPDALLASIEAKGVRMTSDAWRGVTPEAQDFVSGLLSDDVDGRLSVDEALAHKWLNVNNTPTSSSGGTGTPTQ